MSSKSYTSLRCICVFGFYDDGMNYWKWAFERFKRQLWWQAVSYGILGVITAFVALGAERILPVGLPWEISREAVASLLNVISSSMLAVTTFSLGAMTSAFGAATSNVTPRATQLLMEDRTTHNVLSTFIGAFVFSIVSMIVLNTGSYGERGRMVLFVITIGVIVLIVVQLLRWINHLISLGRMGTTIDRVEEAAVRAITQRLEIPYLGANPWWDGADLPKDARPILSQSTSYIQFIDMRKLSELADKHELQIYIPRNAGSFLYKDTVIAYVLGKVSADLEANIRDQFIVGSKRSFDQDPRFGLIVMAEIGSRALSPATNDAGTALDVIGRITRLLSKWSEGRENENVSFPRLHLKPLREEDLFEDAFLILSRDGAHLVEIQIRLQKSLAALQRVGNESFRAAAKHHAELAMQRAQAASLLPQDLQRIEHLQS